MKNFITIAAHNTIENMKSEADIICPGKGDQLVIQKAIDDCISTGKNIYLLNGTYVIDDFYDMGDGGPKCSLCVPNCRREIYILGQNFTYIKDGGGVIFYVPESTLDSIDEESVDVLRTTWTNRGITSGAALKFENISIALSCNQKPIRCIDLRRCDRVEIKNVRLTAYYDMDAGLGKPPVVPAEGCIGLTMTDGSNNCFSEYTNVFAFGFYEGFQAGGEHVVMTACGAAMCYYGYTFGNYEINCGANHPITLINCCDERNVCLPLFNICGDEAGGKRIQGDQEVTMISYNIERIAAQCPGGVLGDVMREVHPGTWKGNIDFTAQLAWCCTNEKHFQMWENDGSGTGFKTRNNCHKHLCSTEERLSYYPMYGQQIFDTDLNKMLICVDPSSKKWVDLNGNIVS